MNAVPGQDQAPSGRPAFPEAQVSPPASNPAAAGAYGNRPYAGQQVLPTTSLTTDGPQPQLIQPIVVNLPPTSGWAIAGLVFALLGVPLVGLVLSIVALNKTKDPTVARGRGLAIAGVIVGAAATVVFVFLWAPMIAMFSAVMNALFGG